VTVNGKPFAVVPSRFATMTSCDLIRCHDQRRIFPDLKDDFEILYAAPPSRMMSISTHDRITGIQTG